jgi:hypothetical protein
VLNQFPQNAFWQLFSAKEEQVRYGGKHYQWKRSKLRFWLKQLLEYYLMEGIVMSYTVDDGVREYTKAHLQYLAPEDVLSRFSPDQRLQGLSPDQRLQGLSPEEMLQRLSPDQWLHGLSPDEVLQYLSPDEIEAYLSKLKSQRSH